jgi:predicted Zn-dependent protease
MDIKRITATLALACLTAAQVAAANPGKLYFSRDELLLQTPAISQSYRKLLSGEAIGASPRKGLELRIARVFDKVLHQALRLHPGAAQWDWEIVLVNQVMPPFTLPDGQIFVSAKWVASRRLTDAEIALLLAHEMAHVIGEHMLERLSAFAAARPAANMRVSDVLRALDEEWHLARELEPLMQAQEFAADHMGLRIVCSAGISRSDALTLFDKMARADRAREPGLIKSHPELLARKHSLLGSMEARSLGCEE